MFKKTDCSVFYGNIVLVVNRILLLIVTNKIGRYLIFLQEN